jgi:hypothetical protein
VLLFVGEILIQRNKGDTEGTEKNERGFQIPLLGGGGFGCAVAGVGSALCVCVNAFTQNPTLPGEGIAQAWL